MIDGAFVEQPTDAHVRLRRTLLGGERVLPPPLPTTPVARTDEIPDTLGEELLATLGQRGLVQLQLDEPLANERFLALGSLLGTPMPETDPAVEPYVERDVILNLVSAHGHTREVSLQPFATNFLTLHTESSARRAEEQPRYIVLMCCEPGDDAASAQTVLVPMTAVAAGLGADDVRLLSQTRYRRSSHGPTIVRSVDGRRVFSFRDFHEQALEWTCAGGDGGGEDGVNAAIRTLLVSMYAPDAAVGVHWTRGTLVVIDNTFFFHGRTAGAAKASTGRRHLKRLRIV